MKILSIIYLFYMFVSIYTLSFFLMVYFHNRKTLFDHPEAKRKYSISVLVPAFNEEKTIQETIEAIFNIDYPIEEVIILNDGSKDRTREISEELLKKYPKLKLVNKENSGKGDSINRGIKMAVGELIVVVDADSYPDKNSFNKLTGYFDDEKIGAVTCVFTPRNQKKFLEKMQVIEYNIIAFTRKLLGYIDGVYVTPGPLAMYRKSALESFGGFDSGNMTEDIEIAWHLIHNGWKVKMSLATHATTTAPDNLKMWYRQRRRWNVGGMQCIEKYRGSFLKKGILGTFIIPFFLMSYVTGLLGLGVFLYLSIRGIVTNYLFVTYSIPVGAPLLTMNDLYITPSFLNYLGVILFVVAFLFTLVVLSNMKGTTLKKHTPIDLLFFSLVYLALYPFIIISSLYNYFKRDNRWR